MHDPLDKLPRDNRESAAVPMSCGSARVVDEVSRLQAHSIRPARSRGGAFAFPAPLRAGIRMCNPARAGSHGMAATQFVAPARRGPDRGAHRSTATGGLHV